MPIREFFHLIHVVEDEDQTEAVYDRLFAGQYAVRKSWMEVEKRWASLAMVSDLMLEVIEPSGKQEDLHMPLSKFRSRFGEHFHSLAWYVDVEDVKPLFERLRGRGIRIAKPGGGLFPDGGVDPGNALFTHPKDTFGQIEFVGLVDQWRRADPRFGWGWSTRRWRDGPLGIERLSHITTLVEDLAAAVSLYTEAFDGRLLHRESTAEADSAFVLVGTDTIIELARPAGQGTSMALDFTKHGELPHAATFKVVDLDAVERHVSGVGIGIGCRSSNTITLDAADTFHAVWAFTTRTLPGDPRG